VAEEPRFGLYVIGDEILSGKRTDGHMPRVIALLRERGLRLSWVRFLPDEREALQADFRRSFAGTDIVMSCGGIGATPDDHTRQAAAAALGVPVTLHPGARDAIAKALLRRGVPDLDSPDARRAFQMGEFPHGARLIENPYNGIPGFTVGRHHFVPGFPVMAWPMIESVLDAEYADTFPVARQAERSLIVYGMAESTVIPLMVEVEERFPGVRTFSLPSVGDGGDGRPARRHIELGVKGPEDLVGSAWDLMRSRIAEWGAETGPS
jgi:molybdopterin-biosynthesis enzyme MoeA-like protein